MIRHNFHCFNRYAKLSCLSDQQFFQPSFDSIDQHRVISANLARITSISWLLHTASRMHTREGVSERITTDTPLHRYLPSCLVNSMSYPRGGKAIE